MNLRIVTYKINNQNKSISSANTSGITGVTKTKMENENENWKICCSNSSSHFIKFFVTFSICFSVMIFSMIQIINNPDKDNSIYFSLISSILFYSYLIFYLFLFRQEWHKTNLIISEIKKIKILQMQKIKK